MRGNHGHRPLTIPKRCCPHVRWLFEEMNRQKVTIRDVAKRAGVSYNSLADWRTRHAPNLATFEAIVNALGYEIALTPTYPRCTHKLAA